MPIALWKDEYCTGDSRIDQEHQLLFDLVNRLHDAIQRSTQPDELQDEFQGKFQALLVTLAAHTADHFEHEEALMQQHAYPGYGRHKQVHDNLQLKIAHLLEQFSRAEVVLKTDLTQFLTEWLAHHIRGEDQKMIQFFQAKAQVPTQTPVGASRAGSAQGVDDTDR